MQHFVGSSEPSGSATPWQPIATAPFDRDLEVAVIDSDGTHAVVFPCRRSAEGWISAQTGEHLTRLFPSHWRLWEG